MWCFLLFSLFVTVQGRAVNISNTWVLPEEGFPVFYRYFRDRISWYEADAVCQFHHANLVTVDTTAQYDAVRAYLKELDISSAVWVGLIRSNPDGDFTWTDYRGLSGDGYWSSAPDSRSAPLCAAADPASDYRWEARACGGPSIASFICELPVPQWALGNEGCMVRELPALTILYLPESAAVQLTADCGLAGVKRVQCTGNKKRDDFLKELSCGVEDQVTTLSIISSATQTTTDTTLTSQEWSKESHSYDFATTEHDEEFNQSISIESTPVFQNSIIYTPSNFTEKNSRSDNTSFSTLSEEKSKVPEILDNNNLYDNENSKVYDKNDILLNNIKEKISNGNDLKHKKLQEELARLGNLDTIFSQTTDHFVPPLVMAKAKLSDDMIALSVEEKLAQQITEHQFKKKIEEGNIHTETGVDDLNASKQVEGDSNHKPAFDDRLIKSPIVEKLSIPKKYNKYYDDKDNVQKKNSSKHEKYFKSITPTNINTDSIDVPSTNLPDTHNEKHTIDDTSMELSIVLKETEQNDENIKSVTDISINENQTIKNTLSMNDEVIKIVLFRNGNESDVTSTILEVTTKIPSTDIKNPENTITTVNDNKTEIHIDTSNIYNYSSFYADNKDTTAPTSTDSIVTKLLNTDTTTTAGATEAVNANQNNSNNTPVRESTNPSEIELSYTTIDFKHDSLNKTEWNKAVNLTYMETTPEYDDFQSPLLSAANEPLHKPNRSRRPQTSQNAKKFNPFRILG